MTQIGTGRWNHFCRSAPNLFIVEKRDVRVGDLLRRPERGSSLGYGCVAHASNGSFGLASESRWANVAGATESLTPPVGWLWPRFEVSPAATSAFGLPALIPLYAAM